MVAVVSVTRPVTQVDVVAVNSASKYGTAFPFTELMGSANRLLPRSMAIKKLSNMICVVERVNFLFIFFFSILLKQYIFRLIHCESSSTLHCDLNDPIALIFE